MEYWISSTCIVCRSDSRSAVMCARIEIELKFASHLFENKEKKPKESEQTNFTDQIMQISATLRQLINFVFHVQAHAKIIYSCCDMHKLMVVEKLSIVDTSFSFHTSQKLLP